MGTLLGIIFIAYVWHKCTKRPKPGTQEAAVMLRKYVFALVATSFVMILMGCGNGGKGTAAPQTETEERLSADEGVAENSEGRKSEESHSDVVDKESLVSEDMDYYSVCTSKSKQEVEAFAEAVKVNFLNDNWAAVSEMTAYPITIQGVEYVDAERLAHADIVLSEEYKEALKAASCENLFANGEGIMLGDGEVWIGEVLDEDMQSEGLKIIAINAEK